VCCLSNERFLKFSVAISAIAYHKTAPNAAMGSPRSKGQQRRRDGFGCSDDQGWDIQIQTNHLSHVLTARLWRRDHHPGLLRCVREGRSLHRMVCCCGTIWVPPVGLAMVRAGERLGPGTHRLEAVGLGGCRWSWLWRTFSAKEEPTMVPTRCALSITSRRRTATPWRMMPASAKHSIRLRRRQWVRGSSSKAEQ